MAATRSSESGVWQLSVAHGKQTLVVAFQPQHPQRVALLKLEVEKQTGVAPKYQRLIYRGKLLLNQAYHQEAAKRTATPAKASDTDEQTSSSSSNEGSPASVVEKKQAMAIDIDSLDDDEVLVQAFRGKANYELILKRDNVVMA